MPALDDEVKQGGGSGARPALWGEAAPPQPDLRVPAWLKLGVVAVLAVLAMLYLDRGVAEWARAHPIPDLASAGGEAGARYAGGDKGRELMWLEQWGQGVCTAAVIAAVALVDRCGRRRALALGIGCLLTFLMTHVLKDLFGRSRPFTVPGVTDGGWVWGWWEKGIRGGSKWASFPSAHTTAAFALSAGLSWFYPRGRALFMGLATMTAAQRVLHTAHYVSDVVAGMGIGVVVMRWSLATRLAGRVMALGPAELRAWWLKDRE